MIVAFVIWSACALVFTAIGIVCLKSNKAVGFFTGMEPPKIRDVKRYNRAVAALWLAAATVFEILGLPFLFLKQNSPAFAFVVLGVVALLIGMMVVYLGIEEKYKM